MRHRCFLPVSLALYGFTYTETESSVQGLCSRLGPRGPFIHRGLEYMPALCWLLSPPPHSW